MMKKISLIGILILFVVMLCTTIAYAINCSEDGIIPSSISDLRLWLKADAITGLNDGDKISTWYDLSGNGYNLVQTDYNRQPTYHINGIDGKPVIRLNASNNQTILDVFHKLCD